MKKLTIVILAGLLVAGFFPSCKRGEKDPFFSIWPRNARMTSKWKLTKIVGTEVINTSSSGLSVVVNRSTNFDGSSQTITSTTATNGVLVSDPTLVNVFSFEMTLDKRGVANYIFAYVNTGTTDMYSGDGTWVWAGNTKYKDFVTLHFNYTGPWPFPV